MARLRFRMNDDAMPKKAKPAPIADAEAMRQEARKMGKEARKMRKLAVKMREECNKRPAQRG